MPKTKDKKINSTIDEDTRKMIDFLKQRAATYGFLSRLYYKEIDEELLAKLKEMLFPTNTGNSNADKGYYLMASYLSNVWENSIVELSIDFTDSFIGNNVDAFSAAYPNESVYTSEKRLFMQDARDEVLALYRKSGLAKEDSWKEGEDHIAVEFEYMLTLCNRACEALENGDEDKAIDLLSDQQFFLEEHLCSWTPMMTADLKKHSSTSFYQGLAWLTDGFLETELELLETILDDE